MSDDQRRRFQEVLEGLRTDPSFSKVNCNYMHLGHERAQELAAALTGHTSVTSLLLDQSHIGPDGAKALAAALHGSSLNTLQLGWSDIRCEGAEALAALLQNSSLTYLDLKGNAIGDEGARALAASVAGSALKVLLLRDNNIGAEGARALAVGIRGSSVHGLALSDNNVGDEGVLALAAPLPLRSLDVQNAGVGAEGALAVAAVLQDSLLTRLMMHDNIIGEEGGQALLRGVKGSRLAHLGLENTGCSADTLREIQAVLEENKSRSFVLQMQVQGQEPEWVFSFRTFAGTVAAVLQWSSDRDVHELPEAVFTEMRASGFEVPELGPHNLQIVKPDGAQLRVLKNAPALNVQLAGN